MVSNYAEWENVKEYSESEVGYGTKPADTESNNCVDPRTGIVLLIVLTEIAVQIFNKNAFQ